MIYKLLKQFLLTIAILLCVMTHVWTQNNATFTPPQNLGPALNSATNDENPVLAPSGLSLYFSSDRPGGLGGRDIYVSQRATLSSAWGTPSRVAILNSTSNEVPGTISPDGREMILNTNRTGGIGGTDLWLSTRTDPNNDFGWTTPVNLGAVINSTFGEQNANYFVEPVTAAVTVFFTSDRSSGTANVKDIFQSTRNADGTFNPPTLVNELNSAADEARTAISRDGLEIFLSSTRLAPTTTIQSMFVSTRTSMTAPWNPPVPVGILNAGGTAPQPSLSPDGLILYFVSNRPGGSGSGDLYAANRCSLYLTTPCINRIPVADFDGDGQTDFSVFRPSDGTWYLLESGSNTFRARQFGMSGDKIVPGDYDGDGRTDMAVYRPNPAQPGNLWYILRSSDSSYFITVPWGISTDTPVPGDYDGDGRTDVAVYRAGVWYIVQSSNGNLTTRDYGSAGDIPVAGANAQ